MTWPAGQQNGPHVYRELQAKETNMPPNTALVPTAGNNFFFDWGNAGFTDGRFSALIQASNANTLSITASGYDSDGSQRPNMPPDPLIDLILPNLSLVTGNNSLVLAWDDSNWPGSWTLFNSAGLFGGAMTSNPTWAKNYAMISFAFINGSGAGTLTFADFNVALKG